MPRFVIALARVLAGHHRDRIDDPRHGLLVGVHVGSGRVLLRPMIGRIAAV
jgi:hypothetical protein